MSTDIRNLMNNLSSADDSIRYPAFQTLQKITEQRVEWFDEYKHELLSKLSSKNSFQRNIGIVLLCNLAKNDTNDTYNTILDVLMPHIDDEKFVTQRQYLQHIWKVAIVKEKYEQRIIKQLQTEFKACIHKDHYNLLRADILVSLANIMKATDRESIKTIIDELIACETDTKQKKKYVQLVNETLQVKKA